MYHRYKIIFYCFDYINKYLRQCNMISILNIVNFLIFLKIIMQTQVQSVFDILEIKPKFFIILDK